MAKGPSRVAPPSRPPPKLVIPKVASGAPSGAAPPSANPSFAPRLPLPNRSAPGNPMMQGAVPWSQATGTSAREKPEMITPDSGPTLSGASNGATASPNKLA